jgi:chemotaxis protein methyltransferase CheR
MTGEEYELLKRNIKIYLKFDLENYKSSQMIRRLDGYILHSGTPGIALYCSRLGHDRVEQSSLRDFLTINVSEFFRDKEHFNFMRDRIFPELLRHSSRLNIWSAGCSNGSEAYSISIILSQITGISHRILATDIDQKSLDQALAGGPYTANDIRNIPQQFVVKYFNRVEELYYVNDFVRSSVKFKQHDLLNDPYEKYFDLIVCRNVVIYFNEKAKQSLKEKFILSLKENGILFIGATETLLDAEKLGLERLSPCFYRKSGATGIKPKTNIPVRVEINL